ncbi:MAG: flagellar protein FlaG [Anaerocolumna sp.]
MLKIATASKFIESKPGIKEQEAIQSATQLITGVKDGSKVIANTNIDKQGQGSQKGDAQSENKRLLSLIDDTNNKLKGIRRRCEYTYNDEVNRISIKVVDSETSKVIKEIPPEEALESIQKIWEVAGLLVDEKR